MSFYSKYIFPHLMDLAINQKQINILRRELLSQVTGETLEIGMETGLNLKQYPATVKNITVVEPNAGMHSKAKKRALEQGIKIQVNQLPSLVFCGIEESGQRFMCKKTSQLRLKKSEAFK